MRDSKLSRTIDRIWHCLLFVVLVAFLPREAHGQAWEAIRYFQFNIENIAVSPTTPGTWLVRVVFSVTNPTTGQAWDIKTALPFQSPAVLALDIGWDPSADFTNTGSANPGGSLSPVVTTSLGTGAAMPIRVGNLQAIANRCANSVECPGVPSLVHRFWIERSVTPVAFIREVVAGRVGIEGRAVCNGLVIPGCPGVAPYPNVPVRSEVADFAFTATPTSLAGAADARRTIVDIAKCKGCHDGSPHGDGIVPRLSLHGNNRNENLGLCVMCHNPNQTDVPYRFLGGADPRIGGPEVPIDFKTMIHSIHAGGFRETPFYVIGFNSTVNDFSGVRFPAELRDCTNCHVEVNGRGTYELPLAGSVLGTTVRTNSVYRVAAGAERRIAVNPSEHAKITPTAAVCSGCHDKREVQAHMVKTGGASFDTSQQDIGTTVRERCASCHGAGKDKDVRRVHQIRTSSSRGGRREDREEPHD